MKILQGLSAGKWAAILTGLVLLFLLGIYSSAPQLAFDAPIVQGLLFCSIFLMVAAMFASTKKEIAFLLCLVCLDAALIFVPSSSMLHAERYHALLGPEKIEPLEAKLPHLDIQNAPLVSYDMALVAAQRRLSELPGIGSVTQVELMRKQIVNGKLVWIGILEHKRFMAWWSSNTTPGYVRVNANDVSDVELVTKVDGKPLALRYLYSGYFSDSLERHIRMNGHWTTGLGPPAYEVDDQGKPWIVVSTFDRTIGWAGEKTNGVLLVDIQSGAITEYSRTNVPEWIDRVEVPGFIADQITDRLEYVHGWLNPSKTDQLTVSGHLDLVYVDGKSRWLAGLTSTSREGGLVGFISVDTRTKEVHRHAISGVTENVAEHAVENVNPEKRYQATIALPFMVAGTPAYVMTLRDANGVARAYGIVAIGNVQHVATGDTLSAAIRSFQTRVGVNRTGTDAGEDKKATEAIAAKVNRISSEVRNGNTSYTLVLDNQPGRLFLADANLSEQLVVTRQGDQVEVTAAVGQSPVVPLSMFLNQTLTSPAK